MDSNVFAPFSSRENTSPQSECLGFWEGVTLVAIVLFGVGTIVRGLSDPLSALHFYATIFRGLGMVMLLTWCLAALLRKLRGLQKRAARR
jgi:hypothetical protein